MPSTYDDGLLLNFISQLGRVIVLFRDGLRRHGTKTFMNVLEVFIEK